MNAIEGFEPGAGLFAADIVVGVEVEEARVVKVHPYYLVIEDARFPGHSPGLLFDCKTRVNVEKLDRFGRSRVEAIEAAVRRRLLEIADHERLVALVMLEVAVLQSALLQETLVSRPEDEEPLL